jgi:hypothetical protein
MEPAEYMHTYNIKGQHSADRAMTRYSSDLCKMVENNEISTGPGRYVLGVPNAYGNAVFAPNPTVRMQRWGAAHDMSSTKTDVESDLLNLGRPTTRTACGQATAFPERTLTAMPEGDFPQTHNRLVDPPCTLRSSGWNRWAYLCQNPQENVMMPFEWAVDTRASQKDAIYGQLQGPIANSSLARDRQLMCGQIYVEPAVPVPRPQKNNFSDTVPGAPPVREGPPPASRQIVRASGGSRPSNPIDQNVAAHGVLEAPAPFTAYIGSH